PLLPAGRGPGSPRNHGQRRVPHYPDRLATEGYGLLRAQGAARYRSVANGQRGRDRPDAGEPARVEKTARAGPLEHPGHRRGPRRAQRTPEPGGPVPQPDKGHGRWREADRFPHRVIMKQKSNNKIAKGKPEVSAPLPQEESTQQRDVRRRQGRDLRKS